MPQRVLIYSHDSFGLGHLRRCRAVAHALVEEHPDMSVLILSGSPIIGSFDFRNRVDFVRIPGVIKLRNGEYTSHSLQLHVEDTLALRASIIRHTADTFQPDLFIVDKEPLGLRGEVRETLEMLKELGEPMVHRALIVLGPFMPSDVQAAFLERVQNLDSVEAITFDPGIETLFENAAGVVAMGGYNTFCEILSFDKPALIVPRCMPRREQLIRAQRADELGLVKCLEPDQIEDTQLMATALRHLPQQQRPSEVVVPGLLDGLDNVNRLADRILSGRARRPVALEQQNG